VPDHIHQPTANQAPAEGASGAANLLDRLLARLAEKAMSPRVRKWARDLLERGERSDSVRGGFE
jgi:hypothetical protein